MTVRSFCTLTKRNLLDSASEEVQSTNWASMCPGKLSSPFPLPTPLTILHHVNTASTESHRQTSAD